MKNITSIPDNIFKILSRNNNWILTKIQYDNKECDDELLKRLAPGAVYDGSAGFKTQGLSGIKNQGQVGLINQNRKYRK